MSGRKMHQTTVRFGPDLWGELEVEAARAGVSVAQYVRDAALMRVAYTRGREADPHYGSALEAVASARPGTEVTNESAAARTRSRITVEEALALASQNAQAIRHARELRAGVSDRRRQQKAPAD
jgi:hypothetical protein